MAGPHVGRQGLVEGAASNRDRASISAGPRKGQVTNRVAWRSRRSDQYRLEITATAIRPHVVPIVAEQSGLSLHETI